MWWRSARARRSVTGELTSLTPVMMLLWSDTAKRIPASQLEFGLWQASPATSWVLERAQIVSVHAKVGIFLKFDSVIKLLSCPHLSALAWKGQKRKEYLFFPSSYLYATLPANSGIFNFLGFQSCMEMGAEQGSQSLPTGQSSLKGPLLQPRSRCLLCLESSRGWAVSRRQPGGSCVTICACSLLVCPTRSHLGHFWCHSSRAARFGADFLFQHSWLILHLKQGVGLLAALLSASPACTPAVSVACFSSRLPFSVADTLTPSQKCSTGICRCLGSAPGHCLHKC